MYLCLNIDIYYPVPCAGSLTYKICVTNCPNSNQPLNTSSVSYKLKCLSNTYTQNVTCQNCDVYESYPYLDKICVPTDSNNNIQSIMENLDTEIILSNIAISYK